MFDTGKLVLWQSRLAHLLFYLTCIVCIFFWLYRFLFVLHTVHLCSVLYFSNLEFFFCTLAHFNTAEPSATKLYTCVTWMTIKFVARCTSEEWCMRSPQETNNTLFTCTHTEGRKPPWRTTWQQTPFNLHVKSCTACSRQRSVSSYITSELDRQHVHGRIHWCKRKASPILDVAFVFSSENVKKNCWGEISFEDLLLLSKTVHIWDFCFEAIFSAKTLTLLNLSNPPLPPRRILACFRLDQFLILITSSFLLVFATWSQNSQPTNDHNGA